MKLRVGIVGLGSQWDTRHLPALRSLADRFEVRGICEQVAHLAQRAAAELGAVAVDGFRALAARDDIDAILYLADQWYGATPILAACDHGKAVYSAISLPVDADGGASCSAAASRSRASPSWPNSRGGTPRPRSGSRNSSPRASGRPRMLFCHRRVPLPRQPGRRRPRPRAARPAI